MDIKVTKKTRKTLDEYLGIVGLAIIAVIGTPLGGLLRPIGDVAGLSVAYYLIKRRNDSTLTKKTQIIGWILFVVWLLEVGIVSYIEQSKSL